MKPRRVILTLEVETDLSIGLLRKCSSATLFEKEGYTIGSVIVRQAQANVIRPGVIAGYGKPGTAYATINPTPKKK